MTLLACWLAAAFGAAVAVILTPNRVRVPFLKISRAPFLAVAINPARNHLVIVNADGLVVFEARQIDEIILPCEPVEPVEVAA